MGLISLLFQENGVVKFAIVAIPLLFSIMIHEIAHGWVADKMGDSTARWLGRLTFNPLKHLDPVGTIMLLFVGFGWAKPVPINPNAFRNLKKGLIFVSAAGVSANLVIAFISYFLLYLFPFGYFLLFGYVAEINLLLASVNLLPIPPSDGSKILMCFVPRRIQYSLESIEPYGLLILLGLVMFGAYRPIMKFFQLIILSIIKFLFSV